MLAPQVIDCGTRLINLYKRESHGDPEATPSIFIWHRMGKGVLRLSAKCIATNYLEIGRERAHC